MALPKFQCGQHKLYANQTEFLLPSALIDSADWEMFDSDIIYDISCWFHSHDPGGNVFDWISHFQTDDFAFFVAPAPLVGTSPLLPTNVNPPVPTQYVHSYHADILQVDIKNLAQRSNTAATDILAPHPLWQSTAITGSINIKKRHSSLQTFQFYHLSTTEKFMIGTSNSVNKQHPLKLISAHYVTSKKDMLFGHITYLHQLSLKWVVYCS